MARKKYEVILSRRADKMLLSHAEFLARISSNAARRLLADFRKVTDMLADNPFLFPFADDMDARGIPLKIYRKCLFDGRYKALYLVENTKVYMTRSSTAGERT